MGLVAVYFMVNYLIIDQQAQSVMHQQLGATYLVGGAVILTLVGCLPMNRK